MAGIKRRTPAGEKRETVEGDYANLEAGEYEARLVYVADLGMHENSYLGEEKPDVQKIALGFEILDNKVQVGGEMEDRVIWYKPFNIYNTLTEKGAELAIYSVFQKDAEKGETPDWEAQLGKPCNLFISHNHSKTDKAKKYDTITKIEAVPAKYMDKVSTGNLTPGLGDADEPNSKVMKSLHGLAYLVFKQRRGNESEAAKEESDKQDATNDVVEDDDFDDDIPF